MLKFRKLELLSCCTCLVYCHSVTYLNVNYLSMLDWSLQGFIHVGLFLGLGAAL